MASSGGLKLKYVFLDGKFVKFKKAKISVLCHSLHYGSAVFEGIRFYETPRGPAVFRLDEHLERLLKSAKIIGMKPSYSVEQMKAIIRKLIKINKLKSGYIRPLFFYGVKMGLVPENVPLHFLVACWEWPKYLSKAVKVGISKFIRPHPKSFVASAKISGFYANSVLASLDIKARGFDEAILFDYRGKIAEGPGENLFIVKDGKLYTPREGSILPGITRASVMEIAKSEGIKTVVKDFTIKDLKNADEAFFTGTAAEITPIVEVEGKKIGKGNNRGNVGEITSLLMKRFYDIVHGRDREFEKWLFYV